MLHFVGGFVIVYFVYHVSLGPVGSERTLWKQSCIIITIDIN